jgi:phosphatidylserine/phosphatidylglycerophosphate/cardiolipin synthase-like enzyme
MEEETKTEKILPGTSAISKGFRRDVIYFVIIIILAALCGQFWYSYHYQPKASRDITIFYNQDKQANVEITRTIQDADKFVYFAIYTFTREDIRDALLAAKYKGLDVRGLVDKRQSGSIESQKAIVKSLEDAGIPLAYNDHSYIMHLKTVVTDKAYVSGSYNWTAAATNLNDEIIEIGKDEDVRKQYEQIIKTVIEKYARLN